ncbi:MAG: CDGSH iron-sulfur domain-containing protein [Planctomycetota bacterium]
MTDEVEIRCRKNGPLLVTGPVRLIDHERQPFDVSGQENIALCRCGASQKRPFCDGSHRLIAFEACELASEQQNEHK